MFTGKSRAEWIAQYQQSHQHPVNRTCHMVGIPLVAFSIALLMAGAFLPAILPWAVALFVLGWVFQFTGHWVEGKPPEFLKDWRFLFVGLAWWWAKLRGKA
ncbi:MAG: DUF962 domain-containing protein [Gammaproteobacteria bacterium]|nr:MAG: DUF962 domain-containing protein [Gammaproteobacteria bacterium]